MPIKSVRLTQELASQIELFVAANGGISRSAVISAAIKFAHDNPHLLTGQNEHVNSIDRLKQVLNDEGYTGVISLFSEKNTTTRDVCVSCDDFTMWIFQGCPISFLSPILLEFYPTKANRVSVELHRHTQVRLVNPFDGVFNQEEDPRHIRPYLHIRL
jgi:hypothetical protein